MEHLVVAELVAPCVAGHGEGAVWFERDAVLRSVDVHVGDVLTWTGEAVERGHVADYVAMLRPCADGTAVVAARDAILIWDPVSGSVDTLVHLPCADGVRLNDGACTPDGDLLIGGISSDRSPSCRLLRVTPEGAVDEVLSGVTISNGLGFLADGRSFYYIDSITGRVDVVGYRDGVVTDRLPFVELGPSGGPDGLCVDSEDGIWVAVWGGWAAQHYTRDGVLDVVVTVPTPHVTSVAIGGPDLDTLYITTSRRGLGHPDPLAGSLFAAPVRVPGRAELYFARQR